jgi:hypothetical protein
MTLVELILVMATLATVFSLSAPTLSRFFKGRTAAEEARRFLSLTRYGRSCAISTSVPYKLWIDAQSGDYGLSPLEGFGFEDEKPVEISPDSRISFALEAKNVGKDGRAAILFWPDGSIDSESPDRLSVVEQDEGSIAIARLENGLGYEIPDGNTQTQ